MKSYIVLTAIVCLLIGCGSDIVPEPRDECNVDADCRAKDCEETACMDGGAGRRCEVRALNEGDACTFDSNPACHGTCDAKGVCEVPEPKAKACGGDPLLYCTATCDFFLVCNLNYCEDGSAACIHSPLPEGFECGDVSECALAPLCDGGGMCAVPHPKADGTKCNAGKGKCNAGNCIDLD